MSVDPIDRIPEVIPAPLAASDILVEEASPGESLEKLEYRTKLAGVEQLEHALVEERSMLTWRKAFAILFLLMCVAWMGFIGVYLWHFGEITIKPKRTTPKPVSDAVLIALITTTTINVLGLLYIVARWLFPQKTAEPVKVVTV